MTGRALLERQRSAAAPTNTADVPRLYRTPPPRGVDAQLGHHLGAVPITADGPAIQRCGWCGCQGSSLGQMPLSLGDEARSSGSVVSGPANLMQMLPPQAQVGPLADNVWGGVASAPVRPPEAQPAPIPPPAPAPAPAPVPLPAPVPAPILPPRPPMPWMLPDTGNIRF